MSNEHTYMETDDSSDSDASSSHLGLDDDIGSFEVGLQLVADQESGFHTKNDPSAGRQWHREDITQRKGLIGIQCNMTDVIHGKWKPGSDACATLVVFLFRFDVKKESRRIARAEILIDFYGSGDGNDDSRPLLQKISFEGSTSIVEEKQSENITSGGEGTLSIAALEAAQLSGTLKKEKTVSRDTFSYTGIVGNMNRNGYTYGGKNQVQWVLLENARLKSGVPSEFRTAVLLKREDNNPFRCDVTFKIKADVRSTLEDFFAKKEVDDPVLFNPRVVAVRENKTITEVDLDAMGNFDVESVSDVTFLNIRSGAIKHT